MKWLSAWVLAATLAFGGCVHRKPPPRPRPIAAPHYLLGAPYQAGGHWYYPAEDYAFDGTGIAAVQAPGNGLTADGELADATALTAAMQTIQLPAIAEITNLDNGRQIRVRVNDRGPASPSRLIALSPRAGALLLIPAGGAARVRVRLDTVLSHRIVDQVGGGPLLAIATAPAGEVAAQTLPPPDAAGHPRVAAGATTIGAREEDRTEATLPDRLPEAIIQTPPDPGQLWLRAGSFGRFNYANEVAARLGGLGSDVLRSRDGRQEVYAVRAGPFGSIAEADAGLAQALAAGVVDAHITVE